MPNSAPAQEAETANQVTKANLEFQGIRKWCRCNRALIDVNAMAHLRQAATVTGTSLFGLGFRLSRARCVELFSSHVLSPGIGGNQDGKIGFSQISAFSLKPSRRSASTCFSSKATSLKVWAGWHA